MLCLPSLAEKMFVFCSKSKPSTLHWITSLLPHQVFLFSCVSSSLYLPLFALYQMLPSAYKDLIPPILKGKKLSLFLYPILIIALLLSFSSQQNYLKKIALLMFLLPFLPLIYFVLSTTWKWLLIIPMLPNPILNDQFSC